MPNHKPMRLSNSKHLKHLNLLKFHKIVPKTATNTTANYKPISFMALDSKSGKVAPNSTAASLKAPEKAKAYGYPVSIVITSTSTKYHMSRTERTALACTSGQMAPFMKGTSRTTEDMMRVDEVSQW